MRQSSWPPDPGCYPGLCYGAPAGQVGQGRRLGLLQQARQPVDSGMASEISPRRGRHDVASGVGSRAAGHARGQRDEKRDQPPQGATSASSSSRDRLAVPSVAPCGGSTLRTLVIHGLTGRWKSRASGFSGLPRRGTIEKPRPSVVQATLRVALVENQRAGLGSRRTQQHPLACKASIPRLFQQPLTPVATSCRRPLD